MFFMPGTVARHWAYAVAAAVSVSALSACAAYSTSRGTASPLPVRASALPVTASTPPVVVTARQVCLSNLSKDQLLSWADGTVADFRAYEYGGPIPTRPMSSAFSGLSGETTGAWCGTRLGNESTRWWAVVDDRPPVKALDIDGPGEGVQRGPADGPPRVP